MGHYRPLFLCSESVKRRMWLLHSCQSGCSQPKRSRVRNRVIFVRILFTVNFWNYENKEKEAVFAHLWKIIKLWIRVFKIGIAGAGNDGCANCVTTTDWPLMISSSFIVISLCFFAKPDSVLYSVVALLVRLNF